MVVRDLDEAVRRWSALGIGPWQIHSLGAYPGIEMTLPVQDATLRGRPQAAWSKFAFCDVGPLNIELIEPRDGPSIYTEHLAHHGEGLHHLGYFVDDIGATVAAMERLGYGVTQTGHGFGADGDGAFAYFDTERELGCVLEAIQAPRALPTPLRWYPEGTAR